MLSFARALHGRHENAFADDFNAHYAAEIARQVFERRAKRRTPMRCAATQNSWGHCRKMFGYIELVSSARSCSLFNRLMQPTTNMMPRWPRQQQQQLSMRPTPGRAGRGKATAACLAAPAAASKTGDAHTAPHGFGSILCDRTHEPGLRPQHLHSISRLPSPRTFPTAASPATEVGMVRSASTSCPCCDVSAGSSLPIWHALLE